MSHQERLIVVLSCRETHLEEPATPEALARVAGSTSIASSVVLTGMTVALGTRYLGMDCPNSRLSAVVTGLVWWGVNVALDLPLFSWGPMRRNSASYLAGIGLTFCIYPITLVRMHAGHSRGTATARFLPDAVAGAGDSSHAAKASGP